eukprot:TRINITY_DN3123_c0_g1_i1.p1 TRINITY_DN3123_c0_g1~~TRINITY_DN3123_c0_g1_i1.p1  ORF type:complete len:409 (+),score=92.58 TRINITY_DN3123_c0_g1_i1:171-1397(+)
MSLEEFPDTTDTKSSPFEIGVKRMRKRCPIPCWECRKAHKKCDGDRPCARCVQMKKDCTDPPSKAGPRKPKGGQGDLNFHVVSPSALRKLSSGSSASGGSGSPSSSIVPVPIPAAVPYPAPVVRDFSPKVISSSAGSVPHVARVGSGPMLFSRIMKISGGKSASSTFLPDLENIPREDREKCDPMSLASFPSSELGGAGEFVTKNVSDVVVHSSESVTYASQTVVRILEKNYKEFFVEKFGPKFNEDFEKGVMELTKEDLQPWEIANEQEVVKKFGAFSQYDKPGLSVAVFRASPLYSYLHEELLSPEMGQIVYLSEEFQKNYGWTMDMTRAFSLRFPTLVHSEDVPAVLEVVMSGARQDHRKPTHAMCGPFRLTSSSGRFVWSTAEIISWRASCGVFVYFFFLVKPQ